MNIIEDKYFLHLDPELEKRGYVAKDVHSLRFKYVYTEEEQAERHLLFERRQSTMQWLNFCNKDVPMRSEHMAAIMDAISKSFICYQYDDESGVPYASYQWDLFFWCNDFYDTHPHSGLSGRDYSYFTLSFMSIRTVYGTSLATWAGGGSPPTTRMNATGTMRCRNFSAA